MTPPRPPTYPPGAKKIGYFYTCFPSQNGRFLAKPGSKPHCFTLKMTRNAHVGTLRGIIYGDRCLVRACPDLIHTYRSARNEVAVARTVIFEFWLGLRPGQNRVQDTLQT